MKFGLKENQLHTIINILAYNPKIEEALIFGSRAKGNYKPGSDIDLCIKGNMLELVDILDLQNKFEDSSLPYLFDIVIYNKINEPALTEHIDRVGAVIYTKAKTI